MTNLTSLGLWNNSLGDDGARAIAALTNLTSLNLRKNKIGAEGAKAILDAWSEASEYRRLQQLDLSENGDLGDLLPMEVLENRVDPQATLAAYRSFRQAEAKQTPRSLNEAKLLVVGSEAVDKTSLLRYLIDNQPRNPSEAKTPGIATHERIETATWSPEDCSVRLNVWDFGGQEMMRGTHRFFLTARSLYLLVLEDRRQDDRSIHDWLKIIRNRGAESPIVVVVNKSDDGKEDLRPDEEGLKRAYPNIVAFLRTACNDDDYSRQSIQTLRHQIIDILGKDERLNHVRDSIPQSWLEVKGAVSDLAAERSVLPHDDFRTLCGENGIEDDNEQRSLLRLLHDLGTVVAHGLERDAAAIRGVNLLDPNWLTGAIYQILNHPTVRDQDGEFAREQLSYWLDPVLYGEDRHEFILSMMQDEDIGLCFRLPHRDEERYLVPEALRSSAPEYGIWPKDSLRFRYKYGFLPPGLIPRFIVEAHRELTAKKTRWRTGGVFEVTDCKILVEGHVGTSAPRIDIAVCGLQERRRGALQVIQKHFDRVHELNPECEPQARMPLPDRPEVDVLFDHLLKLEGLEGGEHQFLPEGADRKYAVAELLSGVLREKPVNEVFVSYTWRNQASVAIVNQLEKAFEGRDIQFIRDTSEVNYKDSIRAFMKRLGRGKCVVVVLSEDYLKSDSCMFELTEIAARGDMRDRVFPIVLEDTELFEPIKQIEYIEHWEKKKDKLNAAMKKVGGKKLGGIRQKIDLYNEIRGTAADIMDILGDMNTLTPEQHRGADFDALFRALERRLGN